MIDQRRRKWACEEEEHEKREEEEDESRVLKKEIVGMQGDFKSLCSAMGSGDSTGTRK